MLLTTMDQDRLARLLAEEEQRKRGLTLAPSAPRSALVAALLAQSAVETGAGAVAGLQPLAEEIAEGIKKRKKKPVLKEIPQFDIDPSGLGLVRRQ